MVAGTRCHAYHFLAVCVCPSQPASEYVSSVTSVWGPGRVGQRPEMQLEAQQSLKFISAVRRPRRRTTDIIISSSALQIQAPAGSIESHIQFICCSEMRLGPWPPAGQCRGAALPLQVTGTGTESVWNPGLGDQWHGCNLQCSVLTQKLRSWSRPCRDSARLLSSFQISQ